MTSTDVTIDVLAKIQTIIKELNQEFYEREHIIEAAWAAILSKQHCLLLGPPGTAKSAVIDAICHRIDETQYFQWLLTRFSTPEELFGPISLKGLENDEYRRITSNKLPEAHISFLDEVWKGNAAILNSLLTAINERAFDNGSARTKIPLISLFGASNELPAEEELTALYDRFILRFDLKYIQEAKHWTNLLLAGAALTPSNLMPSTHITLDELRLAQKEVTGVYVSPDVISIMREIKMSLEHEGIVASDRRWKQTVNVLQAWAWLHGGEEVAEGDLELLCDMLWKEPEQRPVLVSKILAVTNPLDLEAIKYYDDCLSVFSQFSKDCASSIKEEVASKLRMALEKIDSTLRIADPAKTKKFKEVQTTIKTWYRSVVEAIEI